MLTLLSPIFLNISLADVLPISSINSSSWFIDGDEPYEDKFLYDGKAGKVWVENDSSSGLGSWVELTLDGNREIETVRILGGNWYSFNEWDYYNRPAELEFSFSDGTKETVSLPNSKSLVVHKLSKTVSAKSVRVTVKKVHSGSAYTDRTAISEIQLITPLGANNLVAKSITASSETTENNDGNYLGQNVQDGLKDTAWCSPSGEGASITLKYPSKRNISSIELINSNAIDLKVSMAYSRPKKLTLTFEDGTETLSVKPFMTLQKLTFPKHSSQEVTITMSDIMSGKQFEDSCISELYLK